MSALAQIFRRVIIMSIGRRRLERWLKALEENRR